MPLQSFKPFDKEGKTYLLSGVFINSEIDLPELSKLNIDTDADEANRADIRLGSVPGKLPNAEHRHGYQINHEEVLLDIPDVARYLIRKGNEILVDPIPTADEKEVRLFLLGSAFGILLHQRGILPMHASAIEVNDHCVLFTGDSGAGKSTIAAFLHEKGYRVLTDDVCAITFDDKNRPYAWPGFPRMKLWSDTLTNLKHDINSLDPDGVRTDKYHLPVYDNFCKHPLPITDIYMLKEHHSSTSIIEPLTIQKSVTAIINNIYRGGVLSDKNYKLKTFQQCMSIAQNTNIYHLSRKMDLNSMDEVLQNLEKHLTSMQQNN